MDSQQMDALWEEYRLLSATRESLTRLPYTVLPISVAVAAVFLGNRVPDSPFAALTLAYGVALLVIALAFIHSHASPLSVRLVELETLINRKTGAEGDEGLAWYSRNVGQFFSPAYRWAVALVTLLGMSAVLISLIEGWPALVKAVPSCWLRLVLAGVPIVLVPSSVAGIFLEEKRVSRRKLDLLNRAGAQNIP